MGQYQTFIVRIWTDDTASSTRGHIQHIASRRGRYFRDEEKMVRFIRDCLGTAVLPIVEPDRGPTSDESPLVPEVSTLAEEGEVGEGC